MSGPAAGRRVRHGWILLGLLALAGALYLARNPGALPRAVGTAAAVREGADEAGALRSPDDLVAWIAGRPGRASLVVLDLAAPDSGLALNAGTPRAVAALPALLLAAAVAGDAAALPATLPAEALAHRRLPGLDRAAPGDTLALSAPEAARRALRGDRAAADALLAAFGRARAEALQARLGVPELEAPLPTGGLVEAWLAEGPDAPRARLREAAFARDAALAADPAARAAALARGGIPLDLDAQRDAARASLPRGTAAAYARLLARALADPAFEALVASDVPPGARGLRAFGYTGGASPGLVAGAAFARTDAHPAGRVAVLILEDVPHAVFYHLAQSGHEVGLLAALVADDAALARARAALAR